jgi:hypothetical protein
MFGVSKRILSLYSVQGGLLIVGYLGVIAWRLPPAEICESLFIKLRLLNA